MAKSRPRIWLVVSVQKVTKEKGMWEHLRFYFVLKQLQQLFNKYYSLRLIPHYKGSSVDVGLMEDYKDSTICTKQKRLDLSAEFLPGGKYLESNYRWSRHGLHSSAR
jgi:hypothetical protein